MPSRRRVLAAGTISLLPGCLGSGRFGTVGCTSGVDVTVRPFAPVEDLARSFDGESGDVVADAVEDEYRDIASYGPRPIDAGLFVEHDGAFYETACAVVDEEPVPARRIDLSWEKGRTPPDGATVFTYEDLPECDRIALDYVVYGPVGGRERGLPTQSLSSRDSPAPFPDGVDSSRLVASGESWVQWDGRSYRVRVGREDTMTLTTYRYTVDEIASDAAGFRAFAAETYLVRGATFSPGAREIVERAVENGRYEECKPVSDDLSALEAELPTAKELPASGAGSWYVALDGSRHRLWVGHWIA